MGSGVMFRYRPVERPDRRQKGSILLLALWCLMFLSLMAVMFGSMARNRIILADNIEKRAEIYDVVSSGPEIFLDLMTLIEGKDIHRAEDLIKELTARDTAYRRDINIGRGTLLSVTAGESLAAQHAMERSVLVDETGKININHADRDTLTRIFGRSGLDEISARNLAGNIIDWRDPDDIVYGSPDRASERELYRKKGYKYYPRNRLFSCLEELLLVKGMDREIFFSARDYLTVYGRGKVNVNTASAEVLEALGLSPGLANKIVDHRSSSAGVHGEKARNTYRTLNDLLKALPDEKGEIDQQELRQIDNLVLSGYADTRAEVFSLLSVGKLERGGPGGKLLCVFDRGGRIMYWGYTMTGRVM